MKLFAHAEREEEYARDAIDDVEEGGFLRLYVYRPQLDQSFFAILKLE